ncbi:MAG: hypothetical protein AMS15_07690 [Planctomycetes bacterium DG_23]|nr:MAG: hypothetical protein AMS15_07690 [Planctomycetes bacterium DG_23]
MRPFLELFEKFLREHGATDPKEAPNWDELPHDQQEYWQDFLKSDRYKWWQRGMDWVGYSTSGWIREIS